MKASSYRQARRGSRAAEGGFTLAETALAMLVLLVGLIGVAELFAVAIRANAFSFNSGAATVAAQNKVEEFQRLSFNDAQLQISAASPDPLTTNVTNYNDTSGGFIRRWSVAAGPTPDTRLVTLRVVPANPDPRRTRQQLDVTTILVRPQN
jgi:Tfp pilus assembly protein PilV